MVIPGSIPWRSFERPQSKKRPEPLAQGERFNQSVVPPEFGYSHPHSIPDNGRLTAAPYCFLPGQSLEATFPEPQEDLHHPSSLCCLQTRLLLFRNAVTIAYYKKFYFFCQGNSSPFFPVFSGKSLLFLWFFLLFFILFLLALLAFFW